MASITLQISGLGTTAATAHIEKALESVPRVRSVRVQSGEGYAVVEHDGASPEKLVNALRSVGYDQVKVFSGR